MGTISTIRTTLWDAIYKYLQTTNPISTNNIYSAMNSKLINTVGYPLVIIPPPNVSFSKLSVSGLTMICECVVNFEIYTTSSQTVKSLTDNVTSKLLAGRSVFALAKFKNMNIDAGDNDDWSEGGKKVHRVTFSVTFRFVERTDGT